ncbi:MAG: hypothetical protein EA406_13215 [Rhodospirillales bacterium]|nr:MAG: hypothetical protein EA406_13215 [Rhodospirillales bacterium]
MLTHYDHILSKREGGPTDLELLNARFRDLSMNVVEPLMQSFAEVLQAHGHEVKVFGRQMSVSPGGFAQNAETVMEVRPRQLGDNAPEGFRIAFQLHTDCRKVLAQVTDYDSEHTHYVRPHDIHPLDGVTPELVEAELLEMVAYVFGKIDPKVSITIPA